MSDFVARLGARAVGRAPLARPRLPAFFEGATGSPEPPVGVEGDDDGLVAAAVPFSDTPQRYLRGVSEDEGPSAAPERAPRSRATGRPPAEPGESRPDVRVLPQERPEAARRGRAEAAPEAPRRQVEVPPPAAPVPARPVARAVPAWPLGGKDPRDPAPATGEVNAPEPPTVRVHIGRLEVRAHLEPAPTVRSPRRDPEPAGNLSLADYLRGRREGA